MPIFFRNTLREPKNYCAPHSSMNSDRQIPEPFCGMLLYSTTTLGEGNNFFVVSFLVGSASAIVGIPFLVGDAYGMVRVQLACQSLLP